MMRGSIIVAAAGCFALLLSGCARTAGPLAATTQSSQPGAEPFSKGTPMSTQLKPMMLEDFDSYASDEAIAKAWYTPHGNWMRQSRESVVKAGGVQSLKIEYKIEPGQGKNYVAICRVQYKWDMTGYNAVQFWYKPDGSGRHLCFQFNIHDARGANIHDLWEKVVESPVGDDKAQLVTIPFDTLEHNITYRDAPHTSPVFLPANCMEIALYIGTRHERFGQGVVYIDDIQAVQVNPK